MKKRKSWASRTASPTTIRSVGWIASVHSDQCGLYVLEEGTGPSGHMHVLKIEATL